jgi:hypothetical protein
MKKVLFVFAILAFLFVINSRAQSIVDTNKVWYNVEYGFEGAVTTFIFSFKGDTIINSLLYKKVVFNDSSASIFNNPIAAREDTTTKQIFFYYPGVEYLAYDFSLQLDSTFITYIDGCVIQLGVVFIDTITLLNGEKRKRITLYGSSQVEQWIEGIGSLNGLFRVGIDFCYDFKFSHLNCFKENDTLKYHNPNFPSCNYTTVGINELKNDIRFTISPNPFTSSTQITLPQTFHNIALAVYDIQGKLLAQHQYKDCSQIQLNRNQLSNGLYFLKLTLDDKEVETGKIVVRE